MKFLGKVPVGSDEESATELLVYEPNEVWLKWWRMESQESRETYENWRAEALDDLNLWEEPEYSIAPGAIYHRYELEVINGLILVWATTAINV